LDLGGSVGKVVGHPLPDVGEVPAGHGCRRYRLAPPVALPGARPVPWAKDALGAPARRRAYGRLVDFVLPAEDDPRRAAVRTWLADHPRPTGRQLAEAGLVAPHWPAPHGLGADPVHQLIVDDELTRAGVRRPVNPIGIGWAGPTILFAGSPEQKERYLTPMLAGEELWCQLFSEPGAGSDLTGLGTRAVRDGDDWVVDGQKVWTSIAHEARWAILVTR